MFDGIQKIPLPGGYHVETLGKERVAGGLIHLISPSGAIYSRLLAQDFAERPGQSALALLEMFAQVAPNLGTEECQAYELGSDVFVGGSESDLWVSHQHPLDRDVAFDDDLEVIYYDVEEWKIDPEEVVGAFLMALKEALTTGEA